MSLFGIEGKKVDRVIVRHRQLVKAIRTYNAYFTVHSTDEIGQYNNDVAEVTGEGSPTLLVDLKENDKRGQEVDLVFTGKREVRRNYNPDTKKDWTTFGHIVLSVQQAWELGDKLIKIVSDSQEGKNNLKDNCSFFEEVF